MKRKSYRVNIIFTFLLLLAILGGLFFRSKGLSTSQALSYASRLTSTYISLAKEKITTSVPTLSFAFSSDQPLEYSVSTSSFSPTKLNLTQMVRRKGASDQEILAEFGLHGKNKPNGFMYRLRTHIPNDKPWLIPSRVDQLELTILDRHGDRWLALYRSPLGDEEYHYITRLYSSWGKVIWELVLDDYISYPHDTEVQDIRYDGTHLFFNAACKTYAKESNYQCSSLICLDPLAQNIKWQTRDLVSNEIFLVEDSFIVASYGFTDEPDDVSLINKSTGQLLDKKQLKSALDYMEIKDGSLFLIDYHSRIMEYELR